MILSDDGTERVLKEKQRKYKNLFFYLRKLKYKSLAGSILKGISLSKKIILLLWIVISIINQKI